MLSLRLQFDAAESEAVGLKLRVEAAMSELPNTVNKIHVVLSSGLADHL